jgi:hypothetical protein
LGVWADKVSRKNRLADPVKFSDEEDFLDHHERNAVFSKIFIVFAIRLACGKQILLTIAC